MIKVRGSIAIVAIVLLTVLYAPIKLAATSHEITKWRNNRAGAVSLTFDDGYLSQATTGKDLLSAKNIRGTFFLPIFRLDWNDSTWDDWRSVAAQGNEVGSHTLSHPYLTELSEQELRLELSQSQAAINLNIPTQSCLTFAYPYGDSNDFVRAVSSEYYIASRSTGGFESLEGMNYYPEGLNPPIHFDNIMSRNIDNDTIELMTSYIDYAEQNNAWLCVHMHELQDPAKVERLSQFLDELLVKDVWVDTFGTIVRYMRERLSSTLAVLSESDSEIMLNLSHSLDNSVFNVPLTIRSAVPNSWLKVLITQGSSEYTLIPTIENGQSVVYYDAIPNAGAISLLPNNASSPSRISWNPGLLSASTVVENDAPAQGFSVWNSGGGTLSYSISVDQSWLNCSPVNGSSTGEQDVITVNYSAASLFPGIYSATITISDPAASNSPQTIPVTLTISGVIQASISRNPSSLSASTVAGSNAPAQAFNMWNSGGGTLSYSVSVDQGWLSCSPASGTSTGEQDVITVNYSTATLFPGIYTATITVSDPGASNSPQTMPVSLTVVSVPQAKMELNFEEGGGTTAYDTSGNNNNGTLNGGVLYTTDHVMGSYALSFDGVDDRVVCPSNSSLRPNDLSVSLWVKHVKDTSSPNYGGIILGPNGYGYSDCFRILDYQNKPLGQINFGDADPIGILGLPFTTNEWAHIVLTYDHTKIRLYQNGQMVVEKPETRNINWATFNSSLTIGRAQWYFKGMIDKVMIFGSALTAEQVRYLYNDTGASSRISLNPSTLSSSPVEGSNAPAQTFNVWNSGGGILSYSISVDQGWLSCSPLSGTSTGEQDAIAVSYATSSLSSGTYSATITISDPAASNTPQTIPVSLTVTAAPKASISKSPSSLSASIVAGTNAPAQTFSVWNSGAGTLNYSISVDQGWLSCNPANGTSTGEQDAIAVSYSTASLSLGTYSATITISDPAASNTPQPIPVSLTVTAAPKASISKSPSSLSASIVAGTNAPAQTFNVWNSGGGTLNYSISVDQGWLSCLPISGTSIGEQDAIAVSYSTASLSLGTYSATITISDPAASNTPQTISVSLAVNSVPQASVSRNPGTLSSSTVVGSNAPAQTFNVWNSGAGTLNYSISVDQSWLSCLPISGTSTGEQDAIAVSYSTASLSLGTYSATITISDSGASNSPQTIPVSLTLVSVPQANMELNFEEGSGTTAYDTSGNNNNGTLTGGVVYTTDRAVGSYALSFDGVDDRVVCPSNSSLRPYDLSVSLWVKHVKDTSSPNYGGIILGPNGYGYSDCFRILDYQNKPLGQINFGDADPVWILGLPFTTNEWSHIVLTYDHAKIRLYQNGQMVVEKPETRNINWATFNSSLTIGRAQWYFNGMIDKVMIFGSALTAQQVQQLYNNR